MSYGRIGGEEAKRLYGFCYLITDRTGDTNIRDTSWRSRGVNRTDGRYGLRHFTVVFLGNHLIEISDSFPPSKYENLSALLGW